jgi:hypothetical protein
MVSLPTDAGFSFQIEGDPVSDARMLDAIASCKPSVLRDLEVVFLNCNGSWKLCEQLQSTCGIPVVVGWAGPAAWDVRMCMVRFVLSKVFCQSDTFPRIAYV